MPRPRTHDDAVRRRLVELAARRLAEGGEHAVSLRDLAREASTSTSAVYTLFGSRAELVEAVRTEAFERFAAALDAAPRTGDDAADLLALGLAYREHALGQPHLYRVMFGGVDAIPPGTGASERAGEALAQPTFAVLRDAAARVVAPVDSTEVALRIWALAHGLVSLELAGELPGDLAERSARYEGALRSLGPALVSGSVEQAPPSTSAVRPPRPPG